MLHNALNVTSVAMRLKLLLSFDPQHLARMPCLLCGSTKDNETYTVLLPSCWWCWAEAVTLQSEEIAALHTLDALRPAFRIWDRPRREDCEDPPKDKRGKTLSPPVPQPALIFPGVPLYIGDMDDAANLQRLQELRICCVINLCAERFR